MNEDYIKLFTDKFKLYVFKERQRVKLTVMVQGDFGITYLWNQEQFEDMIMNWQDEWTGKALGSDIFVGPKLGEDRNRFVRFSSSAQFGCEHRFSYNDMNSLRDEYIRQRDNKMPWDK
jgi:hypothetical protein